MNCDKCHSDKITYYKQRRKDGVMVVTARCENGHHPITGKPFYPISQFEITRLPLLGGNDEAKQPDLIPQRAELPETLLDYVERLRNRNDYFHR